MEKCDHAVSPLMRFQVFLELQVVLVVQGY